jgi:hypothetical protein
MTWVAATKGYAADMNLYVRDNLNYLKTTLDALIATVAALMTDPKAVTFTPFDSIPPMSGVQSAGLDIAESSGAGTAKPIIPRMLFDATTDEGRMFVFRLPGTPTITPLLKIEYYMASANSSAKVKFGAQIAALGDTDTGATAKVFDTQDTVSVTCPDAAGTVDEATITMTHYDSMTKGDWVNLIVERLPSDTTNDTATGDAVIISMSLEYA